MKSLFKRWFKAQSKPRSIVLRHQGRHFNLKEIYDRVNERYFANELQLHITWFGTGKMDYRRRVMLGSFHRHHKLIKINRVLDQADTPPFYVEFIVYHEMLHHVLPPIIERRKRFIHHTAFKEREKQFHDYALAREYRTQNKLKWFDNA